MNCPRCRAGVGGKNSDWVCGSYEKLNRFVQSDKCRIAELEKLLQYVDGVLGEDKFEGIKKLAAEYARQQKVQVKLVAALQLVKDYLEVNNWSARKPYKPVCEALEGTIP